jgi:ATP adenylyltransferase
MKITNHLFVPNKMGYVKGQKPRVDCILCAILRGEPGVMDLLVHQTPRFAISLNLYPYNSGHLMIFPTRHIHDPRDLNKEEILELHELQNMALDILQELYEPHGFNLGFNIGKSSGQSINHLHLHIVPRYPSEIGFIDIIGGAKIIVEDPVISQQKISKAFKERTSTGETF